MLDSAPPSRRTGPGLLVCGLVLALVLVALVPAALWWAGHQSAHHVSAATGIPRCEGTEPTAVADPGGGFERVAIPLTRGFECTLTIKVVNHGDREVGLGQVTVPVGGPGADAGFRVTHIGDDALPADDQVDAVTDLDWSLEPGAEELVDLRVSFRRSGCASEDGFMWVDVTMEVDDLLASHDLAIADVPGFLGTADSSCDS